MSKNKLNYKYILSLYSDVDEFLSNENINEEGLPNTIVSFCIVVEKILKIKLHRKNPFLVFDTSNIRDENILSIIALKKEKDIQTAQIKNVMDRFGIVFKNIFTPDEFQALKDIYDLRNCFIHGYKSDDKIVFNQEGVVKKMGTIWEKISKIAIYLFGKENIKNGKPKKKYTEKELEEALEDEVSKMIQPPRNKFTRGYTVDFINTNLQSSAYYQTLHRNGDKCPRCGNYSFSLDGSGNVWKSFYNPSSIAGVLTGAPLLEDSKLYKCTDCNLELTEKQYEIAKKLLGIRNNSNSVLDN